MATIAVSGVADKRVENEYEQLFQEHYQMIYRTAYSILNNAADAEDVLQTIFLQLIRRELPPDFRSNVKGYFYRAAVNMSLYSIRSRRRYDQTADAELFAVSAGPSDSDSLEQIHARLAEAISELRPKAAQILVLRYAHNYSDAKIAKLLGTTRSVIAVTLFRSRARLRKLMRDCMGGDQ